MRREGSLTLIHPTAIVDPSAKVASNVSIGAYSVIGANVDIAEGTWIGPHVIVNGPTRIGRDNKIYQFASIGEMPQDKKYGGEQTWLEIGDRNVIREYCTFNRGTVQDLGYTRVGDDNWIMAYVHIAHDCIVANNTVIANNSNLAGHVEIEDHAILGGFTLVHQYCRIGAYSFTGYNSGISMDVPPYVMASGYRAEPHGLNLEGMRRRNVSADVVQTLKRAYRILYRSNFTLEAALSNLAPLAEESSEVASIVAFIQQSKRGIIR